MNEKQQVCEMMGMQGDKRVKKGEKQGDKSVGGEVKKVEILVNVEEAGNEKIMGNKRWI